jgi:hypothetical protein
MGKAKYENHLTQLILKPNLSVTWFKVLVKSHLISLDNFEIKNNIITGG